MTILVVATSLIIFFVIWQFNRIERSRNETENALSQVNVQLQRRRDLIPNLVAVVREYASHEERTLEKVVNARKSAARLSGKGDFTAENNLSRVLVDFKVIIEKYPELKANEAYKKLQAQLVEIEENITNARQYYNDSLMRAHNVFGQIPGRLISPLFGTYKLPPYFKPDASSQAAPGIAVSNQ